MKVDRVTLTELRMLRTVAREGSFSRAAVRLGRVQSAVSHAMQKLEASLGVTLWDRSGRAPTLTPEGRAVLAQATRILEGVDALEALADAYDGGVEPELALVVDALFPLAHVVALAQRLKSAFPATRLSLSVESRAAVCEAVLAERAARGVAVGPVEPGSLSVRAVSDVRLVPCVAATHALAAIDGPISTDRLQQEVQIVLSERSVETPSPDRGILSACRWRVADLGAKLELIRAGVGWGNLPDAMVDADASLAEIRVAVWSPDEHRLPLCVVTRREGARGPAARWLEEELVALVSDGEGAVGPPRAEPIGSA